MPNLEAEIAKARNHWRAWVRWFLANYPDRARTQTELAHKIGISGPSLSLLLNPRTTRCPSMETLVGFELLTGISVQTILHTDPPVIPPKDH